MEFVWSAIQHLRIVWLGVCVYSIPASVCLLLFCVIAWYWIKLHHKWRFASHPTQPIEKIKGYIFNWTWRPRNPSIIIHHVNGSFLEYQIWIPRTKTLRFVYISMWFAYASRSLERFVTLVNLKWLTMRWRGKTIIMCIIIIFALYWWKRINSFCRLYKKIGEKSNNRKKHEFKEVKSWRTQMKWNGIIIEWNWYRELLLSICLFLLLLKRSNSENPGEKLSEKLLVRVKFVQFYFHSHFRGREEREGGGWQKIENKMICKSSTKSCICENAFNG